MMTHFGFELLADVAYFGGAFSSPKANKKIGSLYHINNT